MLAHEAAIIQIAFLMTRILTNPDQVSYINGRVNFGDSMAETERLAASKTIICSSSSYHTSTQIKIRTAQALRRKKGPLVDKPLFGMRELSQFMPNHILRN